MTTRVISHALLVDWDGDGSYEDESDRLLHANGQMRLADPASSITAPRGIVDTATFVLDNRDGRYSPLNSDGDLYSDIQDGGAYHAPMYFEVSIASPESLQRVFTGVIKIPQTAGPTKRTPATATLTARSLDETLLAKRVSTPLSQFRSGHDSQWTEADYMRQWLTDAGLSEGNDFVLDPGLFVIPFAWLDDESPLEEIWNLAAACGGRFYCDAGGVFRYENMAHWLQTDHASSADSYTESNWESFRPSYDDQELYSAVTVEVSPRELGLSGIMWQADDVIVVPANSSRTITARLRQPAYAVDSASFSATTAGGVNIDDDVSVTLTSYAQRVEIKIDNSNATYAAYLPTLTLTGIPVDGGPTAEVTATSDDSFWTNRQGRTRTIRQNAFVQSRQQAEVLAHFLVERYETPRLAFDIVGIPGDPTLVLGDRITVEDKDEMSDSRDAFITSIQWVYSSKGFSQTIRAIDATGLYPDDDYFVIGTDSTGGSEVLFY